LNLSPPLEAYQKALRTALRLLRHRDRTSQEIRAKLSDRGFSGSEIDLVLASLTRSGYIDDSRVADRAAERALHEHSVGRLKLEHDLRARGASDEQIERVLADFDEPSETERAEQLLRNRMKPTDSPQKSAAFLVRRGFDEEVVRTVVERVYDDFE